MKQDFCEMNRNGDSLADRLDKIYLVLLLDLRFMFFFRENENDIEYVWIPRIGPLLLNKGRVLGIRLTPGEINGWR